MGIACTDGDGARAGAGDDGDETVGAAAPGTPVPGCCADVICGNIKKIEKQRNNRDMVKGGHVLNFRRKLVRVPVLQELRVSLLSNLSKVFVPILLVSLLSSISF
jgi:hypothetical protein